MKFNTFSSFSIFKLLIQLKKGGKSFSYVQYFTLIAHSITLFIHTEIEIIPFFTHTFFLLYKSNRTRESIHICKDHNQFNAILMFYRTPQIKLNSHLLVFIFSMNLYITFFLGANKNGERMKEGKIRQSILQDRFCGDKYQFIKQTDSIRV